MPWIILFQLISSYKKLLHNPKYKKKYISLIIKLFILIEKNNFNKCQCQYFNLTFIKVMIFTLFNICVKHNHQFQLKVFFFFFFLKLFNIFLILLNNIIK